MMDRTPTVALPFRKLELPRRPGRVVLFLYRVRPSWFAARKLCSWCPTLIAHGGFFSRGKVSHGVCTACAMAAMKIVRGNLPALLFFVAIGVSGCQRSNQPTSIQDGAGCYQLTILSTWSARDAGVQPGELVSEVSLEIQP